jgi:hypothetical protein
MYSNYKKPSFVLKATEELKEYIDRKEAEAEEEEAAAPDA